MSSWTLPAISTRTGAVERIFDRGAAVLAFPARPGARRLVVHPGTSPRRCWRSGCAWKGRRRLSMLRGKPVMVNVMTTSEQRSSTERPRLAELIRTTGLAIVMVASDRDPDEVATTVGKLPFPVVFDPPVKSDDNLGATTTHGASQWFPRACSSIARASCVFTS
jgi:hypothetical protein